MGSPFCVAAAGVDTAVVATEPVEVMMSVVVVDRCYRTRLRVEGLVKAMSRW